MPVYVDSSAFVKLFLDEPESEELQAYIERLADPPASSVLLRIEATRTVRIGSASPEAVGAVRAALAGVILVALGDATISRSETIEPAALRTVDAIHLVTALEVGAREMIAYDTRLGDAARAHGLAVASPGA